MRFFIFMIMVFGVFLLAIGKGKDESGLSILDQLSNQLRPGKKQTSQVGSTLEPALSDEATNVPAEANSGAVEEELLHAEPSYLNVSDSEELLADAVLTHGEDYTRRQLEAYAPAVAENMPPMSQTGAASNRQEVMRDIHTLNREALETLSRVDSILQSKH